MKPEEFYEVMVSAEAASITEIDKIAGAIAEAFDADWFSKCGPGANVRVNFSNRYAATAFWGASQFNDLNPATPAWLIAAEPHRAA